MGVGGETILLGMEVSDEEARGNVRRETFRFFSSDEKREKGENEKVDRIKCR